MSGYAKAGRKPKLNCESIYKVLERNKYDIFENGRLNPPSHNIWNKLSEQLDCKILPKSLYISVFQDRYKHQTKLRELLNIDLPNHSLLASDSDSNDNINEKTNDNDYDDDYDRIFPKNEEKALFVLKIPYHTFLKFKPSTVFYKRKNGTRAYQILKPGAWTDIINDAFLKEYQLPCNFIYKSHKVNSCCDGAKYYLNFKAKCKDNNCSLFGWSENEPINGEPLIVKILTKDTRGEELNHTTKRPLKGEKRKQVGQQLSLDLASNWRRHNIADIGFGRISPPNIYRHEVLRKTKQEFKDEALGIKIKCPINSLVEFKNNSQYSGSIHHIAIDPLIVHYWTTHQLVIYKDLRKSYCKVSIDATGGLVKKLKRSSLNLLSSHIFLYEAVVNTHYGQIPITQMVSEKQNTITIFNWLGEWVNSGIRIPNEAVCDFSYALLGAITRAFCEGKSLKLYVETCFDILIGKSFIMPTCYVRIDVAHIIKIFCHIKHLTQLKNKHLKHFYVRGLRLLVTSTELNEFEEDLTALLTVMYCETDGYSENNEITPSEESRQFILKKIKGNDIDSTQECIDTNLRLETENECEDSEISDSLKKYLDNIESISRYNSKVKGDRISAYFLPDLAKDVLRICKHFPLWTCLMQSKFKSPYSIGSSAPVESDFSELKNQILRNDVKPMSIDRFVIKHLQSINSNTKLFRSSQLRNDVSIESNNVNSISSSDNESCKNYCIAENYSEMDKMKDNSLNNLFQYDDIGSTKALKKKTNLFDSYITNSSDSDFSNKTNDTYDEIENWRGKGNDGDMTPKLKEKPTKKIRLTTYMEPMPEIERVLKRKNTRSNLNTMLKNGNICTPVSISKIKYMVHNTCPFDSISSAIAMAYIDYSTYREFIDNSSNIFLKFCKDLALNGSSKKIYTERVNFIKNIFSADEGITHVRLIDAKCNISYIITSLLKNAPSAVEDINCNNQNCQNSNRQASCPTIILRFQQDLSGIEDLLNIYTQVKEYDCTECYNGMLKSKRKLKRHLFIETDVFEDDRQFNINEIPKNLNTNNKSFILYGIVTWGFDHYVVHIRRSENN